MDQSVHSVFFGFFWMFAVAAGKCTLPHVRTHKTHRFPLNHDGDTNVHSGFRRTSVTTRNGRIGAFPRNFKWFVGRASESQKGIVGKSYQVVPQSTKFSIQLGRPAGHRGCEYGSLGSQSDICDWRALPCRACNSNSLGRNCQSTTARYKESTGFAAALLLGWLGL